MSVAVVAMVKNSTVILNGTITTVGIIISNCTCTSEIHATNYINQ